MGAGRGSSHLNPDMEGCHGWLSGEGKGLRPRACFRQRDKAVLGWG